jgi:hypothetical protein
MFDVECSVLDVLATRISPPASFFPRLDTAVAPRYVTHMTKLHLLRHQLAQHHLAALRAAATPPDEFRRLVRRLTLLLGYILPGLGDAGDRTFNARAS